MIIKLNTPYLGRPDPVLLFIKDRLSTLAKANSDISKAEIKLSDDPDALQGKVCEIKLTVSSGSVCVLAKETSFRKSAVQAVENLQKLLLDKETV
jgi:hypothetical protein